MKKEIEENIQEDSSPQSEKDLEEQRIVFSARLVSCLEDKKKDFNKRNKSNIKIHQLKDVYVRGVSFANENLNLHGLARVNMFLRMKEQKKMNTNSTKTEAVEEVTGLVLEAEDSQNTSGLIDISASWAPDGEDIHEAKDDIEKYNLNFDFQTVNELYLETYKPIKLNWE